MKNWIYEKIYAINTNGGHKFLYFDNGEFFFLGMQIFSLDFHIHDVIS